MTDPDYVAPVGRPHLILHVRDKAQPAALEGPRHPSSYGKTLCGEVMWASQQWMILDREPQDTVCAKCWPENLSEGNVREA